MSDSELLKNVKVYDEYIEKNGIDERVINAYCQAVAYAFSDNDVIYGLELTKKAKWLVEEHIKRSTNGGDVWLLERYSAEHNQVNNWVELYYSLLKYEAQNMIVDSYFLYIEKKRVIAERFYLPKRKHFIRFQIIDGLQGLLDDRYDILVVSLVPGGGKTTTEKFFHSGVCGWFPKDYSLFYSHSSDITRMYYDGVCQIVTDAQEYAWSEVFPTLTVSGTNAKMQQLNVGKYKPFPSLQCASVGSENAGKVRASKFLLIDDMIGRQEEALNKRYLDKLWDAYAVDARQRKTVDSDGKPCKEMHFVTRWSVHDIVGRLTSLYGDSDRIKIIAIEDIDPVTGKSNFDYDVGGFSVSYFEDIAKVMDDVSYNALYKQRPVEREGLLYTEEDIRRFESTPLKEPDAVLAICDTKTTGTDYMFLPIFEQYDNDYYLVDCICSNTTNMDVQETQLANAIVDHKVQMVEFESNAGGAVVATNVGKKVSEMGWTCNITSKPTETNKETRIITNSGWIKRNVLFKSKEYYTAKDNYGVMMNLLMSWTEAGKNKFDDVPDGLANFALFIQRKFKRRESRIIRGGLFR